MSDQETIMPHEFNKLERALELAEVSDGSVVVPCRQLRVLVDYYSGKDGVVEGIAEEISQLKSEIEELKDGDNDLDDDDEDAVSVGGTARSMVIPGKR